MVSYGYILPDVTVNINRSDIDYKLYKFDIMRNTIKDYTDQYIAKLGNRVFYSIAHDANNRPLKLQKNLDSNTLYNTFILHGGMFVHDDTIIGDSRIYIVYVDQNSHEIIEVKENQLHSNESQKTYLSEYPKQILFNTSALVNTDSDGTAGIFVSVGGLELSDVDETDILNSPITDITFVDGTNDIYRFNPSSYSFSKLNIAGTHPKIFGHSYAYVNKYLYSFAGGFDTSILDFSTIIFGIQDFTEIGLVFDEADWLIVMENYQYTYLRFSTNINNGSSTGYEEYLCGKSTGCNFGSFNYDTSISAAGSDGLFRELSDTSGKITKLYMDVYGIKSARIVIIGETSGIIYENTKEIFPFLIDIDALTVREPILIYIDLPLNTGVIAGYAMYPYVEY